MSMQINVNPADLTQEQREAVAGFILAYPTNPFDCHAPVAAPEAPGQKFDAVAYSHIEPNPANVLMGLGATPSAALGAEIAHLAKDGEEFDAAVAFGEAPPPFAGDAIAAFGSVSAPLAQSAPFTAGVVQPPIAPVAPLDSSVNIPPAPVPNVAQMASAPTAAPTTPAGGVDLDKNGLPWDARIHAGTKNKNQDGSWKAKRGVDDSTVAQVTAELRALMGAPAAPLVAFPPQIAAAPVAAPVPTPVGVAPSFVPPVPAPPSADPRQAFVSLVGRASAAIQAGKITQAEITQCCAAVGVPALPLLANRLDLVPTVAASVDAIIASRP